MWHFFLGSLFMLVTYENIFVTISFEHISSTLRKIVYVPTIHHPLEVTTYMKLYFKPKY